MITTFDGNLWWRPSTPAIDIGDRYWPSTPAVATPAIDTGHRYWPSILAIDTGQQIASAIS
jgi:hypothetical protein